MSGSWVSIRQEFRSAFGYAGYLSPDRARKNPRQYCEATIAAQIGADEGALNGWLADKVKPTFQSLLKVRSVLERQKETRGGTAPTGYVPIKGNSPNGRRREGEVRK